MFYGILNLGFWGYIAVTVILTQLTIASITIFLHRCQSHRALDLHPIASHVFRFWLWLTTGTVTKEWVAIHRKHHAKCETSEDPHSPVALGIKKVLWQGAELYRLEAENKETLARYGLGTPDDWVEKHVYTPLSGLGIAIMLVLDLLFLGVPGITVWAIQMAWMPFWAAGIINGIGHFWGYRNFECKDAARNIIPWGIFIGGEELHNNHHTFGSSAKLSYKRWEFDLGWCYIRGLEKLGLATVKRVPPIPQYNQAKNNIDVDTFKAVVTNRFQVMARYTKEVILPVLKEEKQRIGVPGEMLFKRAKTLFIREITLLDKNSKMRIASILERCDALKVAYQYRQRLQSIWSHTTASQKELVESLQQWCREAEATGIQALREFSDHLKAYSLVSNYEGVPAS